jgi:hypothetical protein
MTAKQEASDDFRDATESQLSKRQSLPVRARPRGSPAFHSGLFGIDLAFPLANAISASNLARLRPERWGQLIQIFPTIAAWRACAPEMSLSTEGGLHG